MANDIGKLRRSTVVSTFAPGAVVDFRADGAAISGVVSGLEEWDSSFRPAGLANPQKINEPRLEHKLHVQGFRLPPVVDEEYVDKNGQPDSRRLVAARFPRWLQCPRCDKISQARWAPVKDGVASRHCSACTAKAPGRRPVHVVPVRFVMACPAGHLDDFPWNWWVNHSPDCKHRQDLILKAERPGLAGLVVSCPKCKQRRSLEGVFSEKTWAGRFNCTGARPWLYTSNTNPACTETMRAVQRGASNLYFPVISSALSIPAWSDGLQEALGTYWHALVNAEPSQRAFFISMLASGELRATLDELKMTPEVLADEIQRRVGALNDPEIDDIRGAEYRQFTLDQGYRQESDREFETRVVPMPPELSRYFDRCVRVVRLREVRAIRGFTRIIPPGDEDDAKMAPISEAPRDWLPAIEVRGEGIFLEFSADRLSHWDDELVRARAKQIDDNWALEWKHRGYDPRKRRPVTARFLLLHTFAHALMRQLTLDCGYSTAALRERLYVREEPESKMAGVLIYTGTSDTDGTLGGLQRQGEPRRLIRSIPAAIQSMAWCSSDPLCIEGALSGRAGLSISACHACVLAPETACEEFNRFLDRALLVGLPGARGVGYFEGLLGS